MLENEETRKQERLGRPWQGLSAWEVQDRIEELRIELSRARNGFSKMRIGEIEKMIEVNQLVLKRVFGMRC